MISDDIFALAKSLGEVGAADEPRLQTMCAAAEREFTGRLRPGVSPDDCGEAYRLGCACLAVAFLSGAQAVIGEEGFTAGSLTIRNRATLTERAEVMRAHAQRIMGPYLRDDRFAFTGVRG